MSLCVFQSGGGAPLDTKVPVTRLDNRHLVVRRRDEAADSASAAAESRHRPFPSLDEITTRVFDDLLNGKADGNFDDFGVIDLDQNSSKVSDVFRVEQKCLVLDQELLAELLWNPRQEDL